MATSRPGEAPVRSGEGLKLGYLVGQLCGIHVLASAVAGQ